MEVRLRVYENTLYVLVLWTQYWCNLWRVSLSVCIRKVSVSNLDRLLLIQSEVFLEVFAGIYTQMQRLYSEHAPSKNDIPYVHLF
jgi:hypothetical protein